MAHRLKATALGHPYFFVLQLLAGATETVWLLKNRINRSKKYLSIQMFARLNVFFHEFHDACLWHMTRVVKFIKTQLVTNFHRGQLILTPQYSSVNLYILQRLKAGMSAPQMTYLAQTA